ncbi:MAG TPA: oxidoreductase [Acidobacteriaceae bacterium]|jgi:NAD(P)-dependent dehydrogenase (short-subunit alcohol dehydrogenase family)
MSKPKWTAERIPSQAGRRVLVTGANSGIGWHTALELVRKGAEVVLPARTEAKAQDAVKRIQAEVPEAKVAPAILDLADLSSVKRFAAEVGDRPLDLLINNAGVMALPQRELTVDGFERQFATNFLGPFALTALLLPAVLRTPGSRVVTVASTASNYGKIDFDNLQSERVYKPMFGTYSQSKLADLIFAIELQRRLSAAGSMTISTAAHPGYAVTNLQHDDLSLGLKLATKLLKPVLSQDAARGALPTLFAAVAPEAQPGGYYGPDGFQELKGSPAAAKIPAAAKDRAVAERLWTEAEKLTGVNFSVA